MTETVCNRCKAPTSKLQAAPPRRSGIAGYPAPQTPDALRRSIPLPLRERPVYAYIVRSIRTTANLQLVQMGSGPNFDGGRITLCTCKHKDRATLDLSEDPLDPWKNVWVAGLTSKSEDPSRSLAYLMCIERSFLNQLHLWQALPARCRDAKSARNSPLGDVFEPKATATKDPYDPVNYYNPIRDHSHSPPDDAKAWHHDIARWGRWCKPHRLLLGQAAQSYRWPKVRMILKLNAMGMSAHHRIYKSLNDFIDKLQEYDG